MSADPAARPRLSTRVRVIIILVAVVLAGAFAMRAQVAWWLLGDDLRGVIQSEGGWESPRARQVGRAVGGCMGLTRDLRLLHWGGVDGDGSEDDAALGCAAYQGHLDAVRLLVSNGDDVNHPARDRRFGRAVATPPIAQAMRGPSGIPIAELLLAHGARLTAPTPDGMDAVQGAAASRCMACLQWLKQHGAPFDRTAPSTPMTFWLDSRAPGPAGRQTLEQLVALGMSPTAVGADGRTPLHAAAATLDDAAVRWLIGQGNEAARIDQFGMTPLQYAAQSHVGHGIAAAGSDVVTTLMGDTPDWAPTRPKTSMAHSPSDFRIDAAGEPFAFAEAASRDPSIRAFARQLGRPVPYSDYLMLNRLAPDEIRPTIAGLDDATLALALGPGSRWLVGLAEQGDWVDLARATAGWPSAGRGRGRGQIGCRLLLLAVEGANDPSPDRADSWTVVLNWTRVSDSVRSECVPEQEKAILDAMTRRSTAQKDAVRHMGGLSVAQ